MRLLLDSHVVLWAMTWPERLRKPARQVIISPHNEIFVSAATLWELALKVGKGKLTLPENFENALADQNFQELPVRWNHSRAVSRLPGIHSDPFDRLLLAQALEEALIFVTADRLCLDYPVLTMEA